MSDKKKIAKELAIWDVRKERDNWVVPHDYLMKIPCFMISFSPPASGKTLLTLNFVYRFYKDVFSEIFWASPTLHSDNTCRMNVMRDETVIKISDPEELANINAILKYIVSSQRDKLEAGEPLEHILIILDDCVSFVNSKELMYLASYYRHLKISVWIFIQKMKFLTTSLRQMASDVIVFNIPNSMQRKQFFDEFDNYPDLQKHYESACSEKYHWMRLDLRDHRIFHGGPDGVELLYEK